MKRKFIITILRFGFLFLIGAVFNNASAATFTVTSTADSGAGSFRQTVLDANAAATNDVIVFAPSLNGVTITLSSEIPLGGDFPNNSSLTINGPGASLLTIDGGPGSNRIFEVGSPPMTIRGVTLQNGGGPGFADVGSAIRGNFGTITIDGVVLRNNTGTGGSGAVFLQLGNNHSISNSTIADNSGDVCGGLRVDRASLTITNTTISGNNAPGNGGGGLCIWDGSTATIRNTTIAGNSTSGAFGISGGGIYIFSSTVNLGNTIVAGNSSSVNPDIYLQSGTLQTVGGNLIGNNSSVSGAFPAGTPNGNGDKVGIAANLAPLGNYGGTTLTRALLPNSPAINAGNNAAGTPVADQRGAARSGAVDTGAYEANAAYTATLPNGNVGQNYNQTLVSNNGSFNYAQTGGNLPSGLNLTTSFAPTAVVALVGTPTFATTYNFTVTGTSGADSVTTNYSITINTAPTAAPVSVSGRVLTPTGRGLTSALVSLTDQNGNTRTTRTSMFGAFRFEEIQAGQTYIFNVRSKRYRYAPRVVTITEDLTDIDFIANQ